jgi:hypothetical protein
MFGELLARRLVVAFCPGRPGVLGCVRCGLPFLRPDGTVRPARSVSYRRTADGDVGLAILCLWCWPRISVDQRVEYARAAVMTGLWRRGMLSFEECAAVWPDIEAAYRAAR